MDYELGEIILERDFESLDKDGNPGTIQLRVGKPYLDAESDHFLKWRCPFQIIGIGSENIKAGLGIDAIDALLESLRMADGYLKSYSRFKITWMGEEDLGLYRRFHDATADEDKDADESADNPFEKMFDEFFDNFKSKHPRSSPPEDGE